MNDEQLISQIKILIAQIKTFDKSLLYPDGPQASSWNGFTNNGLKTFVGNIFSVLGVLEKKKNENIVTVGTSVLNNLHNHLTSLISAFSSISTLAHNQITTHHHSALSYLDAINDTLRKSGLYAELKIDPKENFSEIGEALTFGKQLLESKLAFEKTSETFKEVLKDKDKFVQKLLLEKSQLFEDTASEYRVFWQLVVSLIFAVVVMSIVYSFIRLGEEIKQISIGFALLRLSALIVPSYFAVFFASEYLVSRKMYKFYKFKSVALGTMSSLYTAYPAQQEKIMDKALSVIFSEFNEKNNGEISQKDLLSFISNIVKNQK